MAWIRVMEEDEGNEDFQEAAASIGAPRRLANILRIHSVHPKAMTAHYALYRELMFGRSDLTRADRETIAVAVSTANACHY